MADEVKIIANLDALKIGDMVLLEAARKGQVSITEQVALLDRVIVGGASELSLKNWGRVVEVLWESVTAALNPPEPDAPEKN